MTNLCPEFTPHQREVFCVFSGQGVHGLRRHLNYEHQLRRERGEVEDDDVTLTGDDDDQTMTGMMGATAINGDEEVDEELEDAEDSQLGVGDGLGGDDQQG